MVRAKHRTRRAKYLRENNIPQSVSEALHRNYCNNPVMFRTLALVSCPCAALCAVDPQRLPGASLALIPNIAPHQLHEAELRRAPDEQSHNEVNTDRACCRL